MRPSHFTAERLSATVNGEPVIALRAPSAQPPGPEITGVDLLPGRGMNVFQVRGFLPGKGELNLFFAQDLHPGENSLGDPSADAFGNLSFKQGGALLVPYANRIRGRLSEDGKSIETRVHGEKVELPANKIGKNPGAERHAMHGLILDAKIKGLELQADAASARARGSLDAGDFQGHWLSKTELRFEVSLRQNLLDLAVTAKNSGTRDLPVGVGWHPYFALPSGDRAQVRLRIPAKTRVLVNNYDDVFPTGKRESTAGTPYEFNPPGGKALGNLYLDDCFVDLERGEDGSATAEIVDPAAQYGMRVTAVSPEIRAFQVYAPPDKNFVALEPQFNLADPYDHRIWNSGENTGMVLLKPGQSVTYRVQLRLCIISIS